jgi:hypothetical protein
VGAAAVGAANLIAGTLFTLVMLLSEIPNTMIKKAARSYDVAAVRRLLPGWWRSACCCS